MSNAIQSLKNQLEAKQQEIRRLHEQLQRIQGHIEGLQNAIAVFERAERKKSPQTFSTMDEFFGTKQGTLEGIACEVLKEAGKPLSGDEMIPLMAARGCRSSKQSVLGAIYRSLKSGRGPFIKLDRGMFGLEIWDGVTRECERAAGTGG